MDRPERTGRDVLNVHRLGAQSKLMQMIINVQMDRLQLVGYCLWCLAIDLTADLNSVTHLLLQMTDCMRDDGTDCLASNNTLHHVGN